MKQFPIMIDETPRFILSRPDRVGDVVITSSCFTSIREKYPKGKLFLLASESMKSIFKNHPDLNDYLSLPNQKSLSWGKRVNYLHALFKELAPTGIVHLHPNSEVYVASWKARIPIRIGYRKQMFHWTLTHSLDDRRSEGTKHEAEYNFDLLQPLGIEKSGELTPNISLTSDLRESLKKKLPWSLTETDFAVLNVTSFSKIARWSASNFATLARWLQKKFGFHIVLTGEDASDYSIMEFQESFGHESKGLLNLAGKTNLGELAWLLKFARILITRATGPSHLAAAVRCPMVVLFGVNLPIYSPTRWKPLAGNAVIVTKSSPQSRFWHESPQQYWKRCLETIAVEEVQKAVQKVLNLS